MRFYLATGYERAHKHAWDVAYLEQAGHVCTLNWSDPNFVTLPLPVIALAEIQAVRTADVVIVALPGALGTHAEFGAALALGKRVILWAGQEIGAVEEIEKHTLPFYKHPGVEVVEGPVSLIAAILNDEL